MNEYRKYLGIRRNRGDETRYCVYTTSPDQLRGYSLIRGAFYGSWKKREDIHQIIYVICVVNQTTPKQLIGINDLSYIGSK